jgi:hypothetical protein
MHDALIFDKERESTWNRSSLQSCRSAESFVGLKQIGMMPQGKRNQAVKGNIPHAFPLVHNTGKLIGMDARHYETDLGGMCESTSSTRTRPPLSPPRVNAKQSNSNMKKGKA